MALTASIVAAAGLLIIIDRVRREHGPGVALLTALLLAGGTSLLLAITSGRSLDALAFTLVALFTYGPSRLHARWVTYVGWTAALLTPVVTGYFRGAAVGSHTLFSPEEGFLALHPISYVAAIGLIGSVRSHLAWTLGTLAALTLWRMNGVELTAGVALIAPGLAASIAWARKHPLIAVAPLVLFAALWNYWLMVQYTAGAIPKDAPVSFAAMVRQQADVHTRPPYVYPLAFPANVFFAWREGVPLSKFDALVTVRPREEFETGFERGTERFLVDGWGPPGVDASSTYRWMDAPQAHLVFPLIPSDRPMLLSVLAFAHGDADAVPTTISIEINGHVIGTGAASPQFDANMNVSVHAGQVGRVLRAGYNRLSIVTSGTHRVAVRHFRIAPAS